MALAAFVLPMAGCGDGDEETPASGSAETTAPSESTGGGTETAEPASDDEPARTARALRIEEFGSSAEGDEREEILIPFATFQVALADGDYDVACANLVEPIRTLLERSPIEQRQGPGCAGVLAGRPASAKQEARDKAKAEVQDVRVEGDNAYVIFVAPGAELYNMPMVREGGEWKVGIVSAPVLVPSEG